MHVSLLTVFPELYRSFLSTSLIKRAQEKGMLTISLQDFRDVCKPKERIDGPASGPGTGMVIRPEVVERAIKKQQQEDGKAYKIFFTPQGKRLDQSVVQELAQIFINNKHLMMVAGRYEGIDERVQQKYADLELSIGDYVLMGGDLPAMVTLEAVLRYMPGIVGRQESVISDSFSGPFFDFPSYTVPPADWHGEKVPAIILSGNHASIEQWRREQGAQKAVQKNFQWVQTHCNTAHDRILAKKFIPPHYVALMHEGVVLSHNRVGTSSVTSFDLHDIARSAKTYGIESYFVVTPLEDQHKILEAFLTFWRTNGIEYNAQRSEAMELVSPQWSFDSVIKMIEKKEGIAPIVIGTSAQRHQDIPALTFFNQELVWKRGRPVLFLLGTAHGLGDHILKRCDYLLVPIEGFSDFNHLSVRAAAAIIFDRWLGINLINASRQ